MLNSGTKTDFWDIWFRNSVSSEAKPNWVRNQLQNIFAPTDHKLAMKLFGSKKALMKERVRQKEIGHWIIHPCSSFRLNFSLLKMKASFVTQANPKVLLGPVHAVAAGGEPYHPSCRHLLLQWWPLHAMGRFQLRLRHHLPHWHWVQFQNRCQIAIMNIWSLTLKGIMKVDNIEQVILDPKLIARGYMSTWFLLDLISSIPLDYIFLIFNSVRGAPIYVCIN